MRVLQVVQCPQRRGAEVFASDLSRALRERGHQVETAYLRTAPTAPTIPLEPGDGILAARGEGTIRLGWALRRRIASFAPDVVQVNGSTTVKVGSLAAWAEPRRGWVLVRRAIGDPLAWSGDRARRWFYRFAVMPPVDGVVAVSQSTLEGLRAAGIRTPARVIPRSVDLARLAPTSRSELRGRIGVGADAPVVAFAGSLTAEKRVDRFLRTIASARSDCLAWIVGDGPERPALEALAASLSLTDRVRFWGAREHVAELLGAADLLLLTSDTEGIPGVVLEAGCMGVPAVATRVGGVAECVRQGETGLLVETTNEPGLARAVDDLLGDGPRRTAMGAAARRLVEERFDLRAAAAKFEGFYLDLLAARRGGAGCAAGSCA